MDLTLATYTEQILRDFTTKDLEDVLPGAPLLEDIARYRSARTIFNRDQGTVIRMVTETFPKQIQNILDRSLATLFKDDNDVNQDAATALQGVVESLETIKANALERAEGPASQKLQRRHEALTEVFDSLNVRLVAYMGNLPTHRALAVLMMDDDDGDGTAVVTDSNAGGDDDGQPSQGLATRSHIPAT